MKVAIVCPYDLDRRGGVQQLTLELAAQLRRLGDTAWVVGPGGSGSGEVRSVGRAVVVPANRSRVPLTLAPAAAGRVREAVSDADLVHVHEPFIPVVGPAALGVSRPLVATFHAAPPRWVSALYRVGEAPGRRLLDGVRRITAVSATAAAALPASWGTPTIVPNAIDAVSYRAPLDRVATRLGFLGRDDPRKGLDILLGAWPAIRRQVRGAELEVAGCLRPDPPSGVRFLGEVDDEHKRRVLGSWGVFAAPNLGGESFGMVVLEAMAAGCAVVASDLPPFRSVLGDTGVYVEPGSVAALADAVVQLMEDPSRRLRLAGAASEAAARYDWRGVAAEYRSLYREAVGA